jgi:UDP-N-acetylglucosamine transferase subunit ALG13
MIFITTGTQAPFDRLIKAIDEIAPILNDKNIVAQVANSDFKPSNIKTLDFISPSEFQQYFKEASLIIAHAGMGTIISALVDQKPLVILPRLTKFQEHRSDHQLATAKKIKELNYVHVAESEEELKAMVINIINNGGSNVLHTLGNYASASLIDSLKIEIALKK